MVEMKPNWKMARQVSRRHTLISTAITTALVALATGGAWVVLRIMGYQDATVELKLFSKQYRQELSTLILLIHLLPVNLYAIILTFRYQFRSFRIAVFKRGL